MLVSRRGSPSAFTAATTYRSSFAILSVSASIWSAICLARSHPKIELIPWQGKIGENLQARQQFWSLSVVRNRFAARSQPLPAPVRDLSLSERMVELIVIARHFRCGAVLCGRQIFTERFPAGVLASSARRTTTRLDGIVHHLGLALGGRPAAMFAKRLMLPVSNDTLLRVVRRRSRQPSACRCRVAAHLLRRDRDGRGALWSAAKCVRPAL